MKRREFLGRGAIAAAGLAVIPSSGQNVSPAPRDAVVQDLVQKHSGTAPRRAASVQPPVSPYPLANALDSDILPKLPVPVESLAAPVLKIAAMSLEQRRSRKVVPQRGFCSIAPGKSVSRESLLSGNGSIYIQATGDPFSEQILFHHERLMVPWKRPFEAPKIASILPELRRMLLSGAYREGLDLAYDAMTDAGLPFAIRTHGNIPAFLMQLNSTQRESIDNYLRSVDFETGEINVRWSDSKGEWMRQVFVSRADDVVAQLHTAPEGHTLNLTITLDNPHVDRVWNPGPITFEQTANVENVVFTGRFDPAAGNSGYAGVTRVLPVGGSVHIEHGKIIVEGARFLLLLTRIAWFADYSSAEVERLMKEVEEITLDYSSLLARHRIIQSSMFNRVSVDFGGNSQHAMAAEELLTDQRLCSNYSPALLEKMFDMGRYWLMLTSGHYPAQPLAGEVNININLQVSAGVLGNLPEAMGAYFNWIEELLPDCRKNAENIFGARGALFPILPNKEMGVSFLYSYRIGEAIWPHPYWLSAGGWCYNPFWDHYLVTGDLGFLRDRIVPGLKELALFYEDFLTIDDENGNYIFVPSFSPENAPTDAEPAPVEPYPFAQRGQGAPTPLVINATMDIMVCREVLTRLIEASTILGSNADLILKWKTMLAKMPPYLLDTDGALKEWAWPTLKENLDHRHISHLYGVWPGDEIDPGRTPQLARAALLADRKRATGTTDSATAFGLCHRALAGARLKDNYPMDIGLRQLLQQGYVGPTLLTSHNPYETPFPDAQGALPTMMMEMLIYSRPGVIELLPALPDALKKGAIEGMLVRTFAKVNRLSWDMHERTEEITITSLRDQQITLVVWHGIESVHAPTGVLMKSPKSGEVSFDLRLQKGKTITLQIMTLSSKQGDLYSWRDV